MNGKNIVRVLCIIIGLPIIIPVVVMVGIAQILSYGITGEFMEMVNIFEPKDEK